MSSKEDDDLRKAANELVARRRRQESEPPTTVEEGPESLPHKPLPKGKHASVKEIARVAAAPGAGLLGIIAIVTQLLQSHVSPEQLTGLRERIDVLETERTQRRQSEYERDLIENCRVGQLDGYMHSVLPRADQLVGPPPKPWFDKCPDMPAPTTGSKAAPKK